MTIQKPLSVQPVCDKRKNGYIILLATLIVAAVGLAITSSFVLLGLDFSRTVFSLEQSNQAKAFANACAEEALQQIRNDTNYAGAGNLSFSRGTCSYTVTSQGGESRTINSSGLVGTLTRKVKITINQINPKITVFSWQEVADF
jgi:hypothetical protein